MKCRALSVIVPAGSDPAALTLTVACALASDLEPLELIVVGPGSDTGLGQCLAAFQQRDARVRFEMLPCVTTDCVSAGLDAAQGEFATLLAPGDVPQPWLWPAQVAVLRAAQVALTYCDALDVYGQWTGGWPCAARETPCPAPDWAALRPYTETALPPGVMMRTSLWRALRRAGAPGVEPPERCLHRVIGAGLRGVRIPRAGLVRWRNRPETRPTDTGR